MSQGLMLLSAIIAAGSRTVMRDLTEELFTQDERPAFNFFVSYYRQYGAFPTQDIMAQNGHALMPALGTLDYNVDRIHGRATITAVQAHLPHFQQALTTRNIDLLRSTVSQIAQGVNRFATNRDVFALHEAYELVMEAYDEAHMHDGAITGVTFGWPGLNELTSGAQPGEVVTYVARPNVGKSFTIAHNAISAWQQNHSVLLVTMEMTTVGMARRLLGMHAGINPDLIKRGTLSQQAEGTVYQTIQASQSGPAFHIVAGNLSKSVNQIDALCQEFSPDAIFIDASYLLDPTAPNRGAKLFEKLADVGKEITSMALTRRRPIFQSVQFNREQKKGKGDVANIGGSDVVGQISSIVVAIMEGDAPNETTQRKYEVIKNRDGPKGEIVTNFLFDPINFSEIETDEDGNPTGVGFNTDSML